MPRLKKPIQDIELLCETRVVELRVSLSLDTFKALSELAESYLEVLETRPKEIKLTHSETLKRARFWLTSGSAPQNLVIDINKKSFLRSRKETEEVCLKAFLDYHPMLKIAEKGRGRPPGISPEAKKRLSFGLAIAALINENPSFYRKKLKAA